MATNTAASFTNHTGNGSAGPFSISFSYLSEAEVDVTVDGVLKTITTHYTFTSATQITFTSGNEPGNGVAVKFQRDTNISTKKVDFQDGSVLTETDLDTNSDQILFAQQEIIDKLGGIEEGATGDQTNAEIRTAVEAATDSNVFTDADHSKLNAIEASATADQTASEIRTLVESASDSNVFTDADHTKLNAIEASATADQTDAEIRAAVEAASDSNVFTDADHTKLNAIEAGATTDQTASEIRTLVESASDSNVFTDADHTKLNAIEASADVTDATNVDAAGAVMNSDLDTKGEILVGDGSGDPTALSVGTNGHILTADSTEATGVKWAANAGGGGGSGISDVVADTTPQLGGNLDVNGNDIVSTSNGDIDLDPNGSGKVVAKGNSTRGSGQVKLNCEQNSHGVIIKGPPHSAAADYTLTLPNTDGAANQVLKSDGSGNLDWVNQTTDTVIGGATGVDFNDNIKARYGSSNELELYHDSTYNIIDNANADLHIKHGAEFQAKFNQDGAVELYYDNDKKIETVSGGVTVNGVCTATSFAGDGSSLTNISSVGGATGADFNDDVNIRFGASNDGVISYVSSTDALTILTADGADILIDSDDKIDIVSDTTVEIYSGTDVSIRHGTPSSSENMIVCQDDSSVHLYFDGSEKLQTLTDGIEITGAIHGVGVGVGYAVLEERQTTGDHGGTFAAGGWQTRGVGSLTEVTDTGGYVSVDTSTGEFTLVAGKYLIHWSFSAFDTGSHASAICEDSDSNGNTIFAMGTSEYIDTSDPTSTQSVGWARVDTDTTGLGYFIKHRTTNTKASSGFGFRTSYTNQPHEVYGRIVIWREGTT